MDRKPGNSAGDLLGISMGSKGHELNHLESLQKNPPQPTTSATLHKARWVEKRGNETVRNGNARKLPRNGKRSFQGWIASNNAWRWWEIVTCHQVLLLQGGPPLFWIRGPPCRFGGEQLGVVVKFLKIPGSDLDKAAGFEAHFSLSNVSSWRFQTFFIFIPIWGRFPVWLIFFKGVETTN